MPELPQQGVDRPACPAPLRPIVTLAVADDRAREELLATLGEDFLLYTLPLDGSAFDQTTWSATSVLLIDEAALDSVSPHLEDALTGLAFALPLICFESSQGSDLQWPSHWPSHWPQPAAYLPLPCPHRQLLSVINTMLRLATLERRAAQQEQVLDHFTESFIAVDSRWQITWLNTATERALHTQRDQILGRDAWQMFPQAATSPRASVYRQAMEQRIAATIEGSSPAVGWFEIDAVPLHDGGVALYLRNATALQEARAAMVASERRLRLFLEHARNYGLAVLDKEGCVLEWLGGAETITGWSAEERVGSSIEIMFTAQDRSAGVFEAELIDAARKGRALDKRWHEKKGGNRFFADGLTVALRDEAGQLQGYGKVFRDATPEKLAEETLRHSQEQLRLIFNSVADGIFGMATDGSCTFLNPAAAAVLGYSSEELMGRPIHDLIHHHRADGSLYSMAECKIREAIREGATLRVSDEVFWRKDGTYFPVRYSVNPMVHEGAIAGAVVAFTDVTEAQRAEAALRDSEGKLRFVLDFMPQKVFTATPGGAIDYFNPAWMAYTGLPFGDLSGWGWSQILHPDDLDEKVNAWQEAIAGASAYQRELRLRDAHGQYRWHLARALPLRDDNGQVSMWIGTATDIHDVKKHEVKLSEELAAEKRNAALLTNLAGASHAINSVLSLGNIVQVLEEKTKSVLAAGKVDVVLKTQEGLPASQSLPPQGAENADTLTAPLVGHGQRELGCIQVQARAGRAFTTEDEAILAQLAAIASVGIENAYLYESLREQDRHKDEFLATLAHELRNPLAPLRTGLDLLKMSGVGESGEKIRNMMERQLAHMVRLVDDLMDVSRVSRGKVELKRERVTLRSIFDTALEASRPQIDACQHRLVVSLPDEPVEVYGDLTRLAQIVSNLLNNAAKYTPDGGTITLGAHMRGGDIVIEISDTGIGIPREMLRRVFELFTQVAPSIDRSHGGLGIGLALVQKLVEMHGGAVSAHSDGLGKGCTFEVSLPVLTSPELRMAGELHSAPLQIGKRILVVDDNIEAAEALGMLLEYADHEVHVAHTGLEAIDAVSHYNPQVLLLDIGLPGMSGYEVAAQLRAELPPRDLIIIALTGWGGEDDRRRSREAGFDFHLTKPVDAKTLFEVLNRFFPSEALA